MAASERPAARAAAFWASLPPRTAIGWVWWRASRLRRAAKSSLGVGFGRRRALGAARGCASLAQQRVQQDRAEGGGADAAQREAAELQREVAGAQHQRDGGHDQVAVLREVDPVVDPDLGARHGDQAEHHDAHAAHHRQRNRLDHAPNLGEKPSTMAISAATTNTAVE
jgi:hypothetical protein